MEDKLLTEKQAAEKLSIQPSTLRTWRFHRRGPNYLKIGGAVRYEESEIVSFFDKSRVSHPAEV